MALTPNYCIDCGVEIGRKAGKSTPERCKPCGSRYGANLRWHGKQPGRAVAAIMQAPALELATVAYGASDRVCRQCARPFGPERQRHVFETTTCEWCMARSTASRAATV